MLGTRSFPPVDTVIRINWDTLVSGWRLLRRMNSRLSETSSAASSFDGEEKRRNNGWNDPGWQICGISWNRGRNPGSPPAPDYSAPLRLTAVGPFRRTSCSGPLTIFFFFFRKKKPKISWPLSSSHHSTNTRGQSVRKCSLIWKWSYSADDDVYNFTKACGPETSQRIRP